MARSRPPSGFRFPLPGSALLAAWREGYGLAELKRDLLAGLTIGIVAVPLSMALAIATGVPPQHGLYTAIVAGAIIALTGGSRFNISGPTAAFVVILFPIVASHGLGGLLIATLMAGLILVALGLARLGNLIQFVPYPVVLGFTAGIAVVIALLQLPDFLGLDGVELGDSTLHNLAAIVRAAPGVAPAELGIGLITLATLILWPRLKLPVPAPLVGLAVGTLAALAATWWGMEVETIASRFSWEYQGQSGSG
ncbi:SulP family inorganic anion transporter, partial [Billgrantia desiderata]|uniref:SulP family inorganic anion transporter n=1 Tax=Billgrantia desiderata TaxID=52021 RepID=UPI003F3748D4